MVFGVFATRKDTPIVSVKLAYISLLEQLTEFESNPDRRGLIVQLSSQNSGLSTSRLDQYFSEVFNRLDEEHIIGLNRFLHDACGLIKGAEFLKF